MSWNDLWVAVPFVFEFVLKGILVVVILSRREVRPGTTLAWIMIILAVPGLGLLAYLLVGEVRLGRRRLERHQEILEEEARAFLATPPKFQEERVWDEVPEDFQQLARLGEVVSHSMPLPGNELQLLATNEEFVDALCRDIEGATSYCHLGFYIYLSDGTGNRIGAALMKAVQRGVTARLLVDSVGSRGFLRSMLCREMRAEGVQICEALPAHLLRIAFSRIDIRNHRKIAVIDGAVGYTGSQNIADSDFAPKRRFAPWIDMMVRIRGPVVAPLQRLLNEDWTMDCEQREVDGLPRPRPDFRPGGVTAQIIGTGPNAFNEGMRQLSHTAFNLAREELILTTPYFVPDESTATALTTASRRGVEVSLVVPARNDSPLVGAASRSYYEAMLQSGVHIHHFTGGLLHAKTITMDRRLALVSTANLDRRSFELNFEVSLVVYDSDFSSHLRLLQKSYVNRSVPIDRGRWYRRPRLERVMHNAAGMLSPLL